MSVAVGGMCQSLGLPRAVREGGDDDFIAVLSNCPYELGRLPQHIHRKRGNLAPPTPIESPSQAAYFPFLLQLASALYRRP